LDNQGVGQAHNDRSGVPSVLAPDGSVDRDERRPGGVLTEVIVDRLKDGLLFPREGLASGFMATA
jgi:hypothetical protein